MIRLCAFLIVAFSLQPSALVFAGYALFVAPQIPEWVEVNGINGREMQPNYQRLHPAHVCKPPNYSQYAAEDARRTEVIKSDTGTLTAAQVLAICPTVLDAKYKRLWDAASAWEKKNISGVALSLLTLGVIQQKPRALAIAAWSDRLWNETYYPRKALISLETEPDCDFSGVGDMPYTVPELSAEVWGQ